MKMDTLLSSLMPGAILEECDDLSDFYRFRLCGTEYPAVLTYAPKSLVVSLRVGPLVDLSELDTVNLLTITLFICRTNSRLKEGQFRGDPLVYFDVRAKLTGDFADRCASVSE